MASKLIAPAQRAAVKDRLRTLPQLQQASSTLAVAVRTLLAVVDDAGEAPVDLAAVWSRLQAEVPRDRLAAAVATVEELAPDDEGDRDAGARAELVNRYATVRPFLPMLTEVLPLGASDAGRAVLAAARTLPEFAGRKRVRRDQVDEALVSGSWRRLVFANPDLPEDVVDHRAYALCVLERLYLSLRRRDCVRRQRLPTLGRPAGPAAGRERVGADPPAGADRAAPDRAGRNPPDRPGWASGCRLPRPRGPARPAG